jgi:tripeptide aminopeptidase
VSKLDLRMLGADVAYTLDGCAPGEICWETLSGDSGEVIIDGITTHRMEARAKGTVNAAYLAGKLLSALPRERCAPETTEGRDGFIHPTSVEGRTERAIVKLILRDFELKGLAAELWERKSSIAACRPRAETQVAWSEAIYAACAHLPELWAKRRR